ncbi:hypothetical protein chiPu_0031834, partial [Chiloscyllium punctatum]|nr:hypothetical protein [Chiloscyllium punctatum]
LWGLKPRLWDNCAGNEEDRRDLTNSLALLKDLISAVDQDVHDCEKRYRLQDVYNRMDPKAVAPMHSGRTFRREDMIRRKLVHDGFLLWKTATGRFKGKARPTDSGKLGHTDACEGGSAQSSEAPTPIRSDRLVNKHKGPR